MISGVGGHWFDHGVVGGLVQGTHVGIELDHGGVGGGGDPLTLIDPCATGFGFITSLVRREVVDSIDAPLQVIGDIGTGREGSKEVDLDPVGVGIERGGEIAKGAAIEVGGIAAGRIVGVMNKSDSPAAMETALRPVVELYRRI